MSEKLKACPFCGGNPTIPEHISGGVSIECAECGADTVFTVTSFRDAIAAWNRRANDPETSRA